MSNQAGSLLRVGEAAERLGVSPQTVKQWIYKGTLRTVQTAGGHHRISAAEVDRFLSRTPARKPARTKSRGGPVILAALSGRNQLRGVVEEVRTDGLMAQIRLRIGDQVLTSVITRDAIDSLMKRSQHAFVRGMHANEHRDAQYNSRDGQHATQ